MLPARKSLKLLSRDFAHNIAHVFRADAVAGDSQKARRFVIERGVRRKFRRVVHRRQIHFDRRRAPVKNAFESV